MKNIILLLTNENDILHRQIFVRKRMTNIILTYIWKAELYTVPTNIFEKKYDIFEKEHDILRR